MAPRPALHGLSLRPDACDWRDDELITLSESVALFFRDGPFDVAALRCAIRRGELRARTIDGRVYTTAAALRGWTAPRSVGPQSSCEQPIEDQTAHLLRTLARCKSRG